MARSSGKKNKLSAGKAKVQAMTLGSIQKIGFKDWHKAWVSRLKVYGDFPDYNQDILLT